MQQSVKDCRWDHVDADNLHGPAVDRICRMFTESVDIFDQLVWGPQPTHDNCAQAIPNSEPLLKPLLKGVCDATEEFVKLALEGTQTAPAPIEPQPISRTHEKESIIELFSPVGPLVGGRLALTSAGR